MKIFLILLGIFWIVGWIKTIAEIDAKADHVQFKFPNKKVKYILIIMLFFAWPYFYFYSKA